MILSDIVNADQIDVVKEQVPGEPYRAEFDPAVYVSKRTGRGPLAPTWLEDYRCKYLRFQAASGTLNLCSLWTGRFSVPDA